CSRPGRLRALAGRVAGCRGGCKALSAAGGDRGRSRTTFGSETNQVESDPRIHGGKSQTGTGGRSLGAAGEGAIGTDQYRKGDSRLQPRRTAALQSECE